MVACADMMSFTQRFALWMRASYGLALVVVGTWLFGSLVAFFLAADFTVSLEFEGGLEARQAELLPFAERFRRVDPDFVWQAREQTETPVADAGAADFCAGTRSGIRLHLTATRLTFSSAFGSIPKWSDESGLVLCSMSYTNAAGPDRALANAALLGAPAMAALILLALARWRRVSGRTPWRSRLGSIAAWRWGLAVGAVAVLASDVAARLLVALGVPMPVGAAAGDALGGGLIVALVMVVFAPVVEEFAFRAWFLTHAGRVIGNIPALVVSATLFSLVHLPSSALHAVVFVVFALVLGALWLHTRSLLACIVAHGTYNAIVLASAHWFG